VVTLGAVILDRCLKLLWVSSDDLVNLLTALEEGEGGHGRNSKLLSDLLLSVDVELIEFNLVCGCLGSKLLVERTVMIWMCQ
jgi:hypothetical protein